MADEIIDAPRRGRPPKATVDAKKNTHCVAVYIGDDRKIEPGETIPDDVDDETRAALIATGFFE